MLELIKLVWHIIHNKMFVVFYDYFAQKKPGINFVFEM